MPHKNNKHNTIHKIWHPVINESNWLVWTFADHIIWILSNKFSHIDLDWNTDILKNELDFFIDSIIRHLNLSNNSIIKAYLLNYVDVSKINKLEEVSAYEYLHIVIELAYITSTHTFDTEKLEHAFKKKLRKKKKEGKDVIKILLEIIKSESY
jgi:hypothetical protein